jgi:hypothetical protein
MREPNEPGYWWYIPPVGNQKAIYAIRESENGEMVAEINNGRYYVDAFAGGEWERVKPPTILTDKERRALKNRLSRYGGGLYVPVLMEREDPALYARDISPTIESDQVRINFWDGIVDSLPSQLTFGSIQEINKWIEKFKGVLPHYG